MGHAQATQNVRGGRRPDFRAPAEIWRHAARIAGDRVAIHEGDKAYTYRMVLNRAAGLAAGLEALGCRGGAVGLVLPNGAGFHIGFLAALLAGAAPAPVNPGYPAAHAARLLRLAAPRAILVPAGLAEPPEVAGARLVPIDADALPEAEAGQAAGASDAPGCILFTGGTTGTSKAVAHRQDRLMLAIRAMDHAWPTWPEGEVWLPVAPMSHIYGLLMGVLNPVHGVATIVVPPRFQPDLVVELLARHRVTVFGGGPASVYAALLAAPGLAAADLSALAVCPSGGAPLPVEIIERWRRATGLQIHEAYGMTEVAPITASTSPGGQRDGTVGRAVPGNLVEIVDLATGRRVLPPGERGEVRVQSPYQMEGYRDAPEETAAALRDGWVHTGDIGLLDADGFLTLTDRKKDVVLVKGFNVFPREVEEALTAHPAVRQVGVVGAPDARNGERLVAFLDADPGTSAEALAAHAARHLPAYMVPAEFRFVGALPLTPAAKLDRIALRAAARQPAIA
jgi:long-chain acyl-CoA synthetase